jgi:hypothetical protein
MWILIGTAFGLLWFGRRIRLRAMFPGGQRWPLLPTLRSMPRWDQERVMHTIGGVALEFAGVVMLVSMFPLI